MLVGFELGHAQKIVQHVELVALGEFSQGGHLLGDEGDRFVGASLPWLIVARTPRPGSRRALSFPPWCCHQTLPESSSPQNFTPISAATPRWHFATFSI